ncbi:MAG: hypothetical protein FD138_4169 [Planctomycetota bacterium]|nr:MAG: hypothetical protein FD138_4169 [Planctomycetota bacterium]
MYYSGDYSAAREALLKSLQFEQDTAKRSTLENLVQALKALPKGDIASVRKDFDASLGLNKLSPSTLSLHYSMLAMTLWMLDEKDAARQTLSLVVDPPKGFTAFGPETRRLIAEARTLISGSAEPPKASEAPANKP